MLGGLNYLALARKLAGRFGASLIGFIRSAASAVATTVASWLGWQPINPFEFMTAEQITDVRAGTATLDLSAAWQAAFDAACAGMFVRPVVLPDGIHRWGSTVTLAKAVPLISMGKTWEEGSCQIDFRGAGTALSLEDPAGSVGWRVDPFLIDVRNNPNTNLTGIYVKYGLVSGDFSRVKVTGKNTYNLDYGVRIRGDQPGANCTCNKFDQPHVSYANIAAIAVGDDVGNGMGGNTTVVGGILLAAKGACLHLTGGQNQIIGGDHSAVGTGAVFHFDGSTSGNNSIVGTEMEIAAGSSHIKISNNASVEHVVTVTSARGLTTGVGDTGVIINDTAVGTKRQRFAIFTGGPGHLQLNTLYLQTLAALATGTQGASLFGQGSGKFLVLKGSTDNVAGMLLLGNSTSSGADPCFPNSAALVAGATDANAVRFVKTSDGVTVTEIGKVYPGSMGTEFQAYYLLAGRTTLPERGIARCAGSPEGAITASIGSQILRDNGGANTVLYVKESGSGNTGWVAK